MARYYFHFEDGKVVLDNTGSECDNLTAAQHEAVRASGEFLRDGADDAVGLWNGKPWRMWVTDKPNGEGKTFFTLRFSAEV